MATRWGGKEENLITGNTEFLVTNTLNEAVLGKAEDDARRVEMDTRSCLDSSILAMFEDSSTPVEARSRVEEESETSLLCALTEILDSVGDEALSPFDSLPDSALLSGNRCRDSPPVVISEKLRSSATAAKPTNECPPPSPQPIESGSQRTEAEQEVFTSASLVNLVRLMHPYCLRVCLEEEGNSWVTAPMRQAFPWGETSSDHRVPLEGEIWRYEKPTDSVDSDEEIDVDVSDDDIPAKRIKRECEEEEGGRKGGERDGGEVKTLRGVLMKSDEDIVRSQTTKEKKRVSFAPVLVTSYWIPAAEEPDLNQLPDLSELTDGLVAPISVTTTTSPQKPSSSESSAKPSTDDGSGLGELSDVASLPAPGGEPKPKHLSLQQYRQLRQEKRLPLVEKQGNYTTRWPSLPETPKELTPIPCLRGTGPHKPPGHHVTSGSDGIRTHDHKRDVGGFGSEVDGTKKALSPGRPVVQLKAVETTSNKDAGVRRPKRVRVGIKTRATLPATVNQCNPTPVAGVTQIKTTQERRSSPDKRLLLVSSDPPNPVLVPWSSSRPSVGPSDQPPPSTLPSPAPGPKKVFCNRDPNLKSTSLLQEIQKTFSKAHLPKELLTTNSPTRSSTVTPSPTVTPTPTPIKPKVDTCKQPQQQYYIHSTRKKLEYLPKRSQLLSDASESSQANVHTSWPSITPPTPAQTLSPEEETADGTQLRTAPPGPPSTTSTQGSFVTQAPACDSGIEATDLTSLLEQFEETQANENNPEGQTSTPLGGSTSARPLSKSEPEPQGVPDQIRTPESILSPNTEHLRTQASGVPEALGIPEQLFGIVDDTTTPELFSDEIVLDGREIAPASQRWKPLAPATPQKKQLASPKLPLPKVIQIIDPRPLPARKSQASTSKPAATPTTFQIQIAVSVSSDHDYCACQDQPEANGTKCNKTQAAGYNASANSATKRLSTVLDAIANSTLNSVQLQVRNTALGSRTAESAFVSSCSATPRSEAGIAMEAQEGEGSKPCSPSPSPPRAGRGRGETRRYRGSSHHSDSRSPLSCSSSSSSSSPPSSGSSSSSSRSRSPRRKSFRPRRSESSSCSSSCSGSRSPTRPYRIPYSRTRPRRSRSRTESWSRSRSRSPARRLPRGRRTDIYSPTYHPTSITESRKRKRQQDLKIQKLEAIDERRVVYVGRIRKTMTHEELRERFSLFGEVENCSLHFRDRGDHYGFVTFYNMEDAFSAIENGTKLLRRPDELPFDLCFGGRRQFCKSGYADLDSNRDVDPPPAPNRLGELDFDSLLKQAQKNLKR